MANLGFMGIFKERNCNYSNGGISSRHDDVIIVDAFDSKAADNAVVILEDKVCGKYRIRAVPANKEKVWTMFGGCFVYTSNGVVPHSGIAIPLHDRIE
jgi:hypothetical protein